MARTRHPVRRYAVTTAALILSASAGCRSGADLRLELGLERSSISLGVDWKQPPSQPAADPKHDQEPKP